MKLLFLFFTLTSATIIYAQKGKGFQFVERKADKQIDILYNGKLLTAYCYYDSVRKPFLYPVNTTDGITVTRGYPLNPRPGERTDHPHHTGIWMNYESVNGLDFWNNSTDIAVEKRNLYGTIRHEQVLAEKANGDMATLVVSAKWLRPDSVEILKETTVYVFSVKDNNFFIDRNTVLSSLAIPVEFNDVKDGFFAIRVARELEMPSDQADVFVDVHGNKTTVPKSTNNDGVTGMYTSSEGKKGDSVWGTKGRWAMLQGKKDGEQITIGMFDHPKNIGYPGYWHARGYGLFAINPLGRKIFSNGKEELDFKLKPHSSVNFRYRILIASGKTITADDMNRMADDFAKSRL
jgi:hypothetical protein